MATKKQVIIKEYLKNYELHYYELEGSIEEIIKKFQNLKDAHPDKKLNIEYACGYEDERYLKAYYFRPETEDEKLARKYEEQTSRENQIRYAKSLLKRLGAE